MKFSKEQLSLIKKQRIEFKNVKSNIGYKFTTLINATSRYGRDIAKYMKFWAKSMKYLITEKDYTVVQAAQETHIDCSRIVDLTGNMFSCAAWTLIKNWKYGEELEKWYRKKFLQENKNTSIPDKEPENDVLKMIQILNQK